MFAVADEEWLQHADGNSTDISGENQPISYGCWIYPTATATDDQVPMAKAETDNQQYNMIIQESDSGSNPNCIYAGISNDGSTTTYAISTSTIAATTWMHVMVVYNDTDIRNIY